MHRLLQRPFLKPPRIMRARELMPAFGLGEPFSSIPGVGPGALPAPQFHDAAIIVAHGNSSLPRLEHIPALASESLLLCDRIIFSIEPLRYLAAFVRAGARQRRAS
jgi:hypothetical protein